ncbi:hypothetical protein EVU96_09330 [Bacillus infantis]|uniref:hypothetical protein n=1 Tax=Bacillus infantis TaxID=324767 RepID=UPI00101C001D|nr:hypothetical protein [Bacillus infantis]RYI30607.1 hypothetical protein EVU96_09330 [Bacillus infantis]
MSTPYNAIFDKFIRKLKGDNQFFNYRNLSEDEVKVILDDHMTSLLERAIDKLYSYGLPDINFYDKDDIGQSFTESLVPQEISLLSDLMYLAYIEEDRNKLKAYGMQFRTSEIDVLFSPANDRKTYLDMLETIEASIFNSVVTYFSRDRLTWKEKSIYGGQYE